MTLEEDHDSTHAVAPVKRPDSTPRRSLLLPTSPAGCTDGAHEVGGVRFYSWTGDIVGFLGARITTNVLDPSEVIQDDYRMLLVLTVDGRVYSGVPAGENERLLRLWVVGQEQPVVIAKSQIESREISSVSMMPEGLLKNLTDAEVLDLVSYLRTAQQARLAEKPQR